MFISPASIMHQYYRIRHSSAKSSSNYHPTLSTIRNYPSSVIFHPSSSHHHPSSIIHHDPLAVFISLSSPIRHPPSSITLQSFSIIIVQNVSSFFTGMLSSSHHAASHTIPLELPVYRNYDIESVSHLKKQNGVLMMLSEKPGI